MSLLSTTHFNHFVASIILLLLHNFGLVSSINWLNALLLTRLFWVYTAKLLFRGFQGLEYCIANLHILDMYDATPRRSCLGSFANSSKFWMSLLTSEPRIYGRVVFCKRILSKSSHSLSFAKSSKISVFISVYNPNENKRCARQSITAKFFSLHQLYESQTS